MSKIYVESLKKKLKIKIYSSLQIIKVNASVKIHTLNKVITLPVKKANFAPSPRVSKLFIIIFPEAQVEALNTTKVTMQTVFFFFFF